MTDKDHVMKHFLEYKKYYGTDVCTVFLVPVFKWKFSFLSPFFEIFYLCYLPVQCCSFELAWFLEVVSSILGIVLLHVICFHAHWSDFQMKF